MEDLVKNWLIHYITGEIASKLASTNWTEVEAKAQAQLKANVHSAWIQTPLAAALQATIAAIPQLMADTPDLETTVKDLANSDWSGAEAAVAAALAKVASPEIAALLSGLAVPVAVER